MIKKIFNLIFISYLLMAWDFKRTYWDYADANDLSGGYNFVVGAIELGEGEVVRLTSFMYKYTGTVTSVYAIFCTDDNINGKTYGHYQNWSVPNNAWVYQEVDLVLTEGMRACFRIWNATNGDDLAVRWSGYYVSGEPEDMDEYIAFGSAVGFVLMGEPVVALVYLFACYSRLLPPDQQGNAALALFAIVTVRKFMLMGQKNRD